MYIGTPHSRHCDDTLLYLDAGKHVLCEKPFAINHEQATRMAAAARQNQRFLMEAIWSRFLPSYAELRRLVASGAVGDLKFVEASFGFNAPFDPAHRLFAPELGGGALLDVGLYPVQLAHMLLGAPDDVTATAEIGETGVDEQIAVVMSYADGPMAVAMAAIRAALPSTARIGGKSGVIVVPAMMHHPPYLEVHDTHAKVDRIETPNEGNGLHYQAEEVHRCLRAGLLESAVMPLADSLRDRPHPRPRPPPDRPPLPRRVTPTPRANWRQQTCYSDGVLTPVRGVGVGQPMARAASRASRLAPSRWRTSRQSPIVRTGTPALRSATANLVSGTSPDVMITVSARTFSSGRRRDARGTARDPIASTVAPPSSRTPACSRSCDEAEPAGKTQLHAEHARSARSRRRRGRGDGTGRRSTARPCRHRAPRRGARRASRGSRAATPRARAP